MRSTATDRMSSVFLSSLAIGYPLFRAANARAENLMRRSVPGVVAKEIQRWRQICKSLQDVGFERARIRAAFYCEFDAGDSWASSGSPTSSDNPG